jgi:hypothetical protein
LIHMDNASALTIAAMKGHREISACLVESIDSDKD